jgi:hypothetical protein
MDGSRARSRRSSDRRFVGGGGGRCGRLLNNCGAGAQDCGYGRDNTNDSQFFHMVVNLLMVESLQVPVSDVLKHFLFSPSPV